MGLVDAVGRRLRRKIEGSWMAPLMNAYPPYLGAGIRVRETGEHAFEVSMTLHPWNQNYLGTHFGGSLYSMCDPFFVLILSRALGSAYEAWDKSAAIRFRRPGKGTVRARFEIPAERITQLRTDLELKGKLDARFETTIVDEAGQLIAEVEKVVHLRTRARS